ncbi:hypothetical protein [Campylobacter corcagiensis]|uniref:Tetratricopeptide repeat protein n=1 Tax=Campylobacter corcagiensis TaxID=1448857 RepID=A0A7M1LGF4_9BACT|nr:hypothetical protein [Campylobacter corcagiensis]QKF64157.1 hypothetical protein CCORG_0270 [Campylobacter corcagiensis]QOQ87648.1 hypothetical protein IMC76_02215 [Campylobacter corcagiensis]
MAIKDNVKELKKVADSEEQFLESIIKSEFFVKKYKKPIITVVIIAILIPLALATSNFIKDRKFKAANEAYAELITDPNNQKAKEKLKSSSKNLYTIYEFRTALDTNDSAKLDQLSNLDGIDPVLKDLINFSAKKDSGEIMDSYAVFMKGYGYLKDGKIEEANQEFVKIAPNSPLGDIARNLRHYNGAKQ